MSTSASLFVDDLPELGEGAKRYVVDCKWAQTVMYHVPGPPGGIEMTEEMLITVCIQRHEDGCGRCNLAHLWKRGDMWVKALADATRGQLQTMAARERRN